MRLLGDAFVARWRDRLVNIHPSLLPAFPGLDTHARALAAGVRFAGCTVHFVRPEIDSGPIIVQAAVPVLPGDDAEAPRRRVLAAEHQPIRWRSASSPRAARASSASGSRSAGNFPAPATIAEPAAPLANALFPLAKIRRSGMVPPAAKRGI